MKRQDAVSFLRAVSMIGVYGGLLMPLVFLPFVIFPFVFSKLIAFQVLIGLTFPAYLVLAWMEPKYRPQFHLLYVAILAYFVAIAMSTLFASDPFRAWWGNQERMNGLFTLLHFFAWLTMAVSLLKTWDQWKKLLHFQVVLSVIMAIVAMMQKAKPDLLLFPAGPRVGGLLDNPIYMAAYQIFNLFFIALLWLRTKSWNVRSWLIVATIFDVIAFLLTQSRGGLAGLGVGILVFAFFYAAFTKEKKIRVGIFSALAVLFVAYGVLYVNRESDFVVRTGLARFVNFQASVTTRLIAWDIAWKGFLERPVFGWGFDNFHILFNLKYNPQSLRFGNYETWFDRSHNTIMDVLSMTGVVGFITFAGMYVMLFYSVIKAFRKKWIDLTFASILTGLPMAYFVQNLFVFDHPAAFSMSYLLFALVIAATRGAFVGDASQDVKAEEQGTKHAFPVFAFVVVFLAFGLLVWRTSVLPYRASQFAINSNNYFSINPAVSYEFAKRAAEIETPYYDDQTFLLSRNMIVAAAGGKFEQLPNNKDWYTLLNRLVVGDLARHPKNTNSWFIAGRLSQEMAKYYPTEIRIAEERYRQAIALSPKRQQLHQNLARLLLQTGRRDEALEVLKNVSEFDDQLGEGYWMYGLALFYDAGQKEAGAEQVVKAFRVPFPYRFQEARELLAYADALFQVNKKEDYDVFFERFAEYPIQTPDFYAKVAARFESLGLTDYRDKMLAMEATIPGIKAQYNVIMTGGTQPSVNNANPMGTAPVQPQPAVATSAGPRR